MLSLLKGLPRSWARGTGTKLNCGGCNACLDRQDYLNESYYSDVLPADMEHSQSGKGLWAITKQVMAGRSGSGHIEMISIWRSCLKTE